MTNQEDLRYAKAMGKHKPSYNEVAKIMKHKHNWVKTKEYRAQNPGEAEYFILEFCCVDCEKFKIITSKDLK